MSGPAESAFAVLTPPGRGGIAVVRCVGPATEAALVQCFRPSRSKKGAVPFFGLSEKGTAPFSAELPCPGHLAYGHVVDAEERPIDEVILYNAGTAFEVNCHGGPAAVRAVCERLAAAGLREVDADRLMQLEGLPRIVRDARRALRRAFTPLAARVLLDQLNGALSGAIAGALSNLALARGGSPPRRVNSDPPRTASCPDALAAIDALLGRWRTCGRFLADPPHIVIAGRPNSGKSTLLNRLVGAERAITSAVPGTTRDYVEAEAALEGAPVVLVDTAGLGEAGGEIERQGIERARQELVRAAVVVYLVDAGEGANPEDEAEIASLGERAQVVLNKIDSRLAAKKGAVPFSGLSEKGAVPFFAPAEKGTVPFSQRREKGTAPFSALAISGLTGEGMPALVEALLENLGWRAPAPGEAVPFTADQAAALAAAREALTAGRVDEATARLKALLE
jgi:tRNA modification GTPase